MTDDYTEKFHIDNGELDGLSPQKIFVLGIEYNQVMEEVRRSKKLKAGSHPIHRENIDRLTRNLDEMGYIVTIIPNGDHFATVRWIKDD